MKLAALLAATAAIVAAPASASDPWRALHRPLRIPQLAPGAACPVAQAHSVSPRFGLALGDGPAYPAGLGTEATLKFTDPPASAWAPSAWSGNKVLWIVAPSYRGPVLIRGRQVDGPNLVRFDGGYLPPLELRIAASSGWRSHPSYTRVRAAGCYAYQVDGTSFSRVIVFSAALDG